MIARGFLLAGMWRYSPRKKTCRQAELLSEDDNFGLAREMYKIDWSATRV